MFKQKPTISDGKAIYVKLVFLNILFQTMFPYIPRRKMVSRKMAQERCMQKSMNSLDKYGRIDGIITHKFCLLE